MMRTYPKQAPMPKSRKNRHNGKSSPAPDFPMTPGLESSLSAKITNIRMALAINSLKNWASFVTNGAG
jgi:hypothetical protein